MTTTPARAPGPVAPPAGPAAPARAQSAPPAEGTARRLREGTGALATAALRRMDERLPWYRAMDAQDRSWVGLVAQAGIAAFVAWYREPRQPLGITADVFGTAPRELTRAVTLQHTLELVRTVVDVVEKDVAALAAPGDEQRLTEAVLRYSREVAFAAAEVYARAAEARGAWDARLEALVVDALVRGEADDAVVSRAAALGWAGAGAVAVLVGSPPSGSTADVVEEVRRAARARSGGDALVGVQGERLVVVLGAQVEERAGEPVEERDGGADGAGSLAAAAASLAAAFGPGPVVLGPVVAGLPAATRSARAALAGLVAARAWPGAPRPVAADELLPERVLAGDVLARRALLDRVHRPLEAAGGPLLDTLSAYLEHGRSLEATARALFVHPNTVRYRLRRAAETTGLDAADPREALVLQVALAVGRLAGGPAPRAHA